MAIAAVTDCSLNINTINKVVISRLAWHRKLIKEKESTVVMIYENHGFI